MSDFHLIPVPFPLYVEGSMAGGGAVDFEGRVIAVAVQGLDPVATPDPDGDGPEMTESLLGWGSTHMLVADPTRPAPLWVGKDDLTALHLPEDGKAPAPNGERRD